MKINATGWLESEDGDPEIIRLPCARYYSLHTPKPLGIVWHYTGGIYGNQDQKEVAKNFCEGLTHYNQGEDEPKSWHILIAKDGTIYQSASFLTGTWHVGRPGTIANQKVENINHYTVGVEFLNSGRLIKSGGKWYAYPWWKESKADPKLRVPDPRYEVPSSRVLYTKEGTFDLFPEAQINSAKLLLKTLITEYGWSKDVCQYSHYQFNKIKEDAISFVEKHLPNMISELFNGD